MNSSVPEYTEFNLMSSRREKYRVEIRKSLQDKELEDKRFRVIKKSTLENKENMIFNIFVRQEINSPSDVFKHIEANMMKTDYSELLQSLLALNHFTDKWEPTLEKAFFSNLGPKKLAQIIADKNHGRKIAREISEIMLQVSGICHSQDLKPFQSEVLSIALNMLEANGEDQEIMTNVVFIIANVCFDSPEFVVRVFKSGILREIVHTFYKHEAKAEFKESLTRLFFNIVEDLKEPQKCELPEDIFCLCKCLLEGLQLAKIGKDTVETKRAIDAAQALNYLAEEFELTLVFDVIEEVDLFFMNLFEIIDKTDKKEQNFIVPLLSFIENFVGVVCISPLFFLKIGLLETLQIIFESDAPQNVKKAAMKIIGAIPFDYNKTENFEAEIFLFFQDNFSKILKGQTCEIKFELLKTLNAITKNCDPSDPNITEFLNDNEHLYKITECVNAENIKSKINTLELLQNILVIGENEMARLNLTANPFALKISQDSSFKQLEGLQQNSNERVQGIVNSLFDSYFDNL